MKKTMLLGVIMVSTLAVVSYFKMTGNGQTPYKMPTVTVKTTEVVEGSIPRKVNAIGTLTAKSVVITPEVPGHVNKVAFKDGASVKQGDVLIQLDDSVFKAKYESSKAKLAYAENKFKRLSKLSKKGIVAKQELEQAEADLKERAAETQEAQVMVNKMSLTAPFNGVVGKSLVHQGDYVNVGQNLVTLTDKKHLRIEYNIPEKYLPYIKPGQTVTVSAVAYPGKDFTGKLSFISPTVNAENRSVSLYADIDNTENLLAPGMFVEATQELGSTENALLIPARSLVPVLDGAKVFKVVDGKAVAVDVIIGQRAKELVQVTRGLSVNDVIITDGQMKVKHGMPVKIES